MTAAMQWLPVIALLTWSLWRLLRQLLPATTRDLQNRIAQRAARRGWTRLGSWLQSGESGAGCGSGCNTCGACGTAAPEAAQPVRLVGALKDAGKK